MQSSEPKADLAAATSALAASGNPSRPGARPGQPAHPRVQLWRSGPHRLGRPDSRSHGRSWYVLSAGAFCMFSAAQNPPQLNFAAYPQETATLCSASESPGISRGRSCRYERRVLHPGQLARDQRTRGGEPGARPAPTPRPNRRRLRLRSRLIGTKPRHSTWPVLRRICPATLCVARDAGVTFVTRAIQRRHPRPPAIARRPPQPSTSPPRIPAAPRTPCPP